jgi:hypothetical protein
LSFLRRGLLGLGFGFGASLFLSALFRGDSLLFFSLQCQDARILRHLNRAARHRAYWGLSLLALQIIFGAR